jgi:hypothetical protein
MPIEYIATLISICQSAIAAGHGLKSLIDERLTEREEEILRTGSTGGIFQIIKANSVPLLFCNSSGRAFHDNDPATAAHCLEAFRKLCHRGYIVPCDGDLFQLSGTGFDIARKLAAKDS